MKVVANFLNIILWILIFLVVFQTYTGITIGILAGLRLWLVTDLFALAALAFDVLVYTGIMGGKNNTLAGISAIFLVGIIIVVLLKYALRVDGTEWLYRTWEITCLGIGAPYLVLRGKKK